MLGSGLISVSVPAFVFRDPGKPEDSRAAGRYLNPVTSEGCEAAHTAV